MPRQRSYDDTLRDRLIDEAALVIVDTGVDTLSVRDVALRAGTTTNAIYTFFGSRGSLIAEVVAKADESFAAAHADAVGAGDRLTDLYRYGLAFNQWAVENPTLFEVLAASDGVIRKNSLPPWAPDSSRRTFDEQSTLVLTVGRLIEAGVLDAADRVLVATYVWAALLGFIEVNRQLDSRRPEGFDLVTVLDHAIAPWVAADAAGTAAASVDLDALRG
ncbi:Transcriptional regulator, TetR family [Actinomycetales bacterium JB111]|nr:Transcriptional regulator, TetR family [Actinomycetales bacterium JB111]